MYGRRRKRTGASQHPYHPQRDGHVFRHAVVGITFTLDGISQMLGDKFNKRFSGAGQGSSCGSETQASR